MATIRQYRKETQTTYVYDAVSKYDPEKKRTTYVHRRLIGKVDPLTGNVVPTGKPGRPRKKPAESSQVTEKPAEGTPDEYKKALAQLRQELAEEKKRSARMRTLIQSMQRLLDGALSDET